jgi:hypothetical protein
MVSTYTWHTYLVTDMSEMFHGATSFNQDISNWDFRNKITISGMFRDATSFNKPLLSASNNRNTTTITDMSNAFRGATSFDQPLISWNVQAVKNMDGMFSGATSFDQALNTRNIRYVTGMNNMLANTHLSTFNYNAILSSRGAKTNLSTQIKS